MEQVTKAIESGIAKFTERYELDASIVSDLRGLLLESCATCVVALPRASSDASAKTKVKSGRRKTGYNCYIKTQFAKAKENAADAECNSQALMTRYSKEWQTLDDAAKQPYLDQANEINAEAADAAPVVTARSSVPSEKKGPKKLSGYNVFYRDNKDLIKSTLAAGEKLMTKVGAEWKALTEEAKNEYNTKAKATEVVSA